MVHPVLQNGKDLLPEPPLRQDEILEEDEVLRPPQPGDHVGKEALPVGKVGDGGVLIDHEIVFVEIPGLPPPGGEALPQLVNIAEAPAPLIVLMGRQGHHMELLPLLLDVAAPQDIEDQPRHRHRQHHNGPGQLVGGTPAGPLNADGHHHPHHLKRKEGDGHMPLQIVGQQQYQRNIPQKQHNNQRNPHRRRNPPLRSLLNPHLPLPFPQIQR